MRRRGDSALVILRQKRTAGHGRDCPPWCTPLQTHHGGRDCPPVVYPPTNPPWRPWLSAPTSPPWFSVQDTAPWRR